MLLSDVVIFGTLPEDLLQKSSRGGVSCAFQGISTNRDDTDKKNHAIEGKSIVLAPDACLCFTHTGEGKQWRARLKPFQEQYLGNVEVVSATTSSDLSLKPCLNFTPECLKCALVLLEDSWICTELSCSKASVVAQSEWTENEQYQIQKPQVLSDFKSLQQENLPSSKATNASISNTLTAVRGCGIILPQASLESLLTSSQHRALVLSVAHYLAPSPRSMKEILNYILSPRSTLTDSSKKLSAHNSDTIPIKFFSLLTSDGRPAYHPEDVQKVVELLASKGTSGVQLELKTEGYALIDLNKYDSKLTKQRVANRAFPKLSANSQSAMQYASLLREMQLYVDRDLFARGRGIMSGLGTASTNKRDRSSNMETGYDEDGHEPSEVNKHTREEEHAESKVLAQYTDLSQCGIEWESGDLALLFANSDLHLQESMDLLKSRQAARLALLEESFRQCQLPPMMITSDEQLEEALRDYQRLYNLYQILMKGMESHGHVSHRARAWYDRIEPERRSASLMQQLKEWWTRQQQLREEWLPVYETLQQETFNLEKEIMKYLDLRSLGII
ncbi:unnamed protein product [Phytomonas sp. EM1]|nr:unnamed protein product [Phytomonas sp. EM1]|eukprot:CCW60557.1 unnamed protein product [Phytomonas sp. isolate EM1]